MVPIATADLQDTPSRLDPSVYPPADADARLNNLWAQHGDPQSSRYSNPELDSLSTLVKYNCQTYPDVVAYLVPRGDSFEAVTWKAFNALTDLAAAHYAEVFRAEIETGNATSMQPTIALLGVGNTFEYWVTQIGLCKLSVRVLLLSDKNANIARDHLLQICNAVGIVVEQRYLNSVQEFPIKITPLLKLDLQQAVVPPASFSRFESSDIWNQHAMIIHSSGSTGLPKPIIHTNRSLMLIARMYRLFQHFIVDNWYLAFPLFHIAGVSIILGGIPSALPTTFPPEHWPPSPGAILAAWRTLDEMEHPVDCLHCAPAVIEDLYEYLSMSPNQDFSPLLKLKILQPGGAALSPVLLKKLTGMGVNVKTTYGSTEIGPPYRTIPDTRENPNCYHIKPLFPDNPLAQMEPQGDGLFECVVYKGFELAAELWQSPDAPNPYRTNDLFLEDPPGSGLFVLQGRKDDIIVHSNGEKTNALPLQMAIEESHADIEKVVVFGTDHPCTSAVLQLSKDITHDIDAIFIAISDACKAFPAFSRIDKSTTIVLPKGERLPVTPKGNVRRKEAWKLYGSKVDALYVDLLEGEHSKEKSDILSDLDNTDFVRHCVANVSGLSVDGIENDSSFYALGLDSQMAVRLRPLLTRRFGKFPLMYIFEYPSVSALVRALSQPAQQRGDHSYGRQSLWIQDAISRYTEEIRSWTLPAHAPSAGKISGEVIYLTGATGALGNALLAEFVSNDKIAKVYCAIRGDSARQRLSQQLADRGYGSEIFGSDKLAVVPYDMSDAKLGSDDYTYERLALEVSTVVHNAWKLDFNQQVDMFERDCLRGTINLMQFSQATTKKRFFFTSSVATNMGKAAAGQTVQEAPIANDPSLALGTGYAQSKFVVEVVSQAYAKLTDSTVRICRVGQLCGHTSLGAWNTSEMFPIMIATGLKHLKAMPVFLQQTVNWLPVNICATAINTLISDSSATSYSVHNLVNPSAIPWSQFLDALETASSTSFERVDMHDWVSRLQKLSEQQHDVPGTKLLGFFEAMAQDEQAESRFETAKTAALVPELRNCQAVGEGLLRLYLEKWGLDGFF